MSAISKVGIAHPDFQRTVFELVGRAAEGVLMPGAIERTT
jgi:hypothetical protein